MLGDRDIIRPGVFFSGRAQNAETSRRREENEEENPALKFSHETKPRSLCRRSRRRRRTLFHIRAREL